MGRPNQLIHLTISRQLLHALDRCAEKECINRSEFIRQAIVHWIRALQPNTTQSTPQLQTPLLMTSRQLEDLRMAITVEIRRRWEAKRQDL